MSTENSPTNDHQPLRAAQGRFLPGKDDGPGRPIHHRPSQARIQWNGLAKPDHVEILYKTIYEKACNGCVSAQKLYLLYLLGEPTEMVDDAAGDNG